MKISNVSLEKFGTQIDEFFRDRDFTTVTYNNDGTVDISYFGNMMTLDPEQVEERNNIMILMGKVNDD
ncbi:MULTISPECIES: hypothetical protein [unclassified Leuconostoc]|uniref:hypothetical protein n=1 Tax=unclassified Leuconostoc TaxID=2685106 RepID=UPI001908033A|nr:MULTISPECIES: hypothetical protein [unclassified Leuconostoc]MBK0041501.1 hypothetical protein [Leuconostoc sp. S51]MBK0052494.1 hypothetical protein [Leuconostoc sp. S50]